MTAYEANIKVPVRTIKPKPNEPDRLKGLAVRITEYAAPMVAESFLKHDIEALTGGDRHQIAVYVEVETVHACSAGRYEIEDSPSIATETAR